MLLPAAVRRRQEALDRMKRPILPLVLGSAMGVYSIAMPYVTTTFFPAWVTIVGILGGLAIPVAAFWPQVFDDAADRWLRRLGRRAAVLLGPEGPVLVQLTVFDAVGFRVHRHRVGERGLSGHRGP